MQKSMRLLIYLFCVTRLHLDFKNATVPSAPYRRRLSSVVLPSAADGRVLFVEWQFELALERSSCCQ